MAEPFGRVTVCGWHDTFYLCAYFCVYKLLLEGFSENHFPPNPEVFLNDRRYCLTI
jgi:hypothetical protein